MNVPAKEDEIGGAGCTHGENCFIYQVLNKTLIPQFMSKHDFKSSQIASGNTVQ